MFESTQVRMHISMQARMYASMHACTCYVHSLFTFVCTCASMYLCMHLSIHASIHAFMNLHSYVCIYERVTDLCIMQECTHVAVAAPYPRVRCVQE